LIIFIKIISMTDDDYMKMALIEAKKAFDAEEVPVGAILVINGKVVARAHNQVELLNDCTAHAEILCLTSAFQSLGTKYLPDATLYVTVEPCLMCCGAIYWSKLSRIVYGAPDIKNGYRKSTMDRNPFHPKTLVERGVLQEECTELMQLFFRMRR
jgi:tRNA(adenine34) deaminase